MSPRMTDGPLQRRINRTRRGQSTVEYALILGAVAISLIIIYGSIGHHEAGLVTAASGALNRASSASAADVEVHWGSQMPVTSSNLRKRLNAKTCDEDTTLNNLACRGKSMLQSGKSMLLSAGDSLADLRLPDIRLGAAGYGMLRQMHLLPQGKPLDLRVDPLTPKSPASPSPAKSAPSSPADAHTRATR